jgi:hypothetical protein
VSTQYGAYLSAGPRPVGTLAAELQVALRGSVCVCVCLGGRKRGRRLGGRERQDS